VAKKLSWDIKQYSARIVGLLIVVEAVSVFFLWALDPVTKAGEAVFAIFLAVDLVSFMMISYIYRTYKMGDQVSRAVLIGACAMILVLVYATLAL
jgi:hypothetical protein